MNIGDVQLLRKAVLAVGVCIGIAAFALTTSYSPAGSTPHEMIEWAGIVLIVICILGRTWTSLYIGGRKIAEVVDVGPYSVMRNPLYSFSILGAAGIGAQQGSVVMALLFGVLAWIAFRMVVSREEQFLTEVHGDIYTSYKARVPRFVPDPKLWRDVPTLTIAPPRVVATFMDAMIFLIAIPIAETFEWLQDLGFLPVLISLP